MPPEHSQSIPFGKLNFDIWKKLAIKLEPLDELGKVGDWRSLASLLRYNAEYITYIQSKQKNDGSCTLELFREYSERSGNSVEEVMEALRVMGHGNALKVLQDVYQECKKEYENSQQREVIHHRNTSAMSPKAKRQCMVLDHVPGQMFREGQENSHHTVLVPNDARVVIAGRADPSRALRTTGGGQLPPIQFFNSHNNHSVDLCSMIPQCNNNTIGDERADDDEEMTDINHNTNDSMVPLECGLLRQFAHNMEYNIGAVEEVMTSESDNHAVEIPTNRQPISNRLLQNGGHINQRSNSSQCLSNTYPRTKQTSSKNKSCSNQRQGSIPDDMKYSPFKSVNRAVRIFITYAYDSKSHMRQVVSLAKCLKDNNFAVSLDMLELGLIAADKTGWLDTRFKNADFVLVCISEQYRYDVESCDAVGRTSAPEHRLNTKFIYKLMQTEYHSQHSTNYRFIPLLFPGVTKENVPTWLQNTLIYNWPAQYQSLLFFLSKPDKIFNSSLGSASKSNGRHPTIISRSFSSESRRSPKPQSDRLQSI